MKLSFLPTLALFGATAVVAGAAVTHGQAADLAGRWTHKGVQTELVVQPRVKLQPYVGPGQGFNYGGSGGFGSATATTVTTEATPAPVARDMTLEIRPGGAASGASNVARHSTTAACRPCARQKAAASRSLAPT